ncbi:MBL fold metallo-hydrolase [Peptoniphilus stercorisuis]|uniref:Glyoxylase-like metal-dependent hydrolase (Beta-lactamase superfamily II) n=1 Tax=Peptoniphilus stercorisuis TaxID=1436965 RepID=A0ABS4KBP5_9FIRM|nr:MBL fold metallo-hydrolase [Peptoniphilus stercorisuis]MBP2025195.1 glyoxylase-like metal-dependent hydrolase (beta-lactamase superfamily II) [Peptoniphilus stercorisuis]
MKFKIMRLAVGSYQTNCYIIFDEDKKAIIVDPGAQAKDILNAVESEGLKVEKILLTHAHEDHIGALVEIKNALNVPVYMGEHEVSLLEEGLKNLNMLMNEKNEKFKVDHLVKDAEIIKFNDLEIKVIFTPGHTRGGVCYLIDNILFSGDTLFMGSIGRTDFPGGDYETIMDSLMNLMKLPNETIVLPGHGPETKVAFEKVNNPFIQTRL